MFSNHATDEPLALAMADLFTNKSVVSLGNGAGGYRKIILQTGKVARYDSFDGSPNIEHLTKGSVSFKNYFSL
jgi:hypothetical protein